MVCRAPGYLWSQTKVLLSLLSIANVNVNNHLIKVLLFFFLFFFVFFWQDRVLFSFEIPRHVQVTDVDVAITPTSLKACVEGQAPRISGRLHQEILVQQSTWQLTAYPYATVVDIQLQKAVRIEWQFPVQVRMTGSFLLFGPAPSPPCLAPYAPHRWVRRVLMQTGRADPGRADGQPERT